MNASPGLLDRAGSEPHASAEELAAYALDPSMLHAERRTHIGACPVCAPEAAWLGAEVAGLEQEAQCPSVDALTRFALGESSSDEQIRIAAHLRDCAVCGEEVELTRTAFRAPAQNSGLIAAIGRVVAMLAPQPAVGVRSGHDAGARVPGTSSYVFSAGDVRVSLHIEPEDDAYVITGVLLAASASVEPAGVESVALLYSQEAAAPALVAQSPVTPSNDFDLHDVPAGTYRLEIVRGGTLMVVSPVTVP